MKRIRYILSLLGIILLFVVVIPCLLNLTLQQDITFCNIIGSSDGPQVWLTFWGAYLSAIGAFIMAFVSFKQSRNESKKAALRIEYEQKQKEYDLFERQHIKFSSIHSSLAFRNISLNVDLEKYDAAIDLCYRLMAELKSVGLYFPRYDRVGISSKMEQYYAVLKEYNDTFIDLNDELSRVLKNIPTSNLTENREQQKDELNTKIQKLIKKAETAIKDIVTKCGKDLDCLGNEVLYEMQTDINCILNKISNV